MVEFIVACDFIGGDPATVTILASLPKELVSMKFERLYLVESAIS